MMTDPITCALPPGTADGTWHWLQTETAGPYLCKWVDGRCLFEGNRHNDISAAAIEVCGWRYIGPVASAEEVEELRKENALLWQRINRLMTEEAEGRG